LRVGTYKRYQRMERIFYRFKGEHESFEDGQSYSLAHIAAVTGLKSITIRERMSRRNARGVVRPCDLVPAGEFAMVGSAYLSLCETETEAFSQQWLRKRLVGVSRTGSG